MNLDQQLKQATASIFEEEFGATIALDLVTINITKKEHTGDFTIVTFPLIKFSKKSPEQTAEILGTKLLLQTDIVASFNVIKGFLNLSLTDAYWVTRLSEITSNSNYGTFAPNGRKVLLEYCSPNTNKPLHIGHVRNILLGFSTSEILTANGYDVTKVSIYNDRGISICKSMVAYMLKGNKATPQSTGIKGDHLVGDYYVMFGKIVDEQLRIKYNLGSEIENIYTHLGKEKEVAEQETGAFILAKELLLKWEAGDAETIRLWKQMNQWVYDGYDVTYKTLGADFQKDYFESETYKLGKEITDEGLAKNIFYKRPDGAVAIDLTADGLDEKVLLRSDGTSIYITQDLGTAQVRYNEFEMEKMIYVVANEQDYHFKVLKLILQKLGKTWADGIHHLSYGLVESPTGRFKSREGKTADADDLISEVLRIAEEKTKELGKIEGFTEQEAKVLYNTIGLGALKYFILRVNPYKKIIFNPEESIDFHGHTGPFIQYTHARICAILRKASIGLSNTPHAYSGTLAPVERELIIQLSEYPNVVRMAAEKYDPSEVSNYVYHIAKLYNKFYNDQPILKAATDDEKLFRVYLSQSTGIVINKAMKLLGIEVPEKM